MVAYTLLTALIALPAALARPSRQQRRSTSTTVSPSYANVPVASGSYQQYSTVDVTPQYYLTPGSGVSWSPSDRFTVITLESSTSTKTAGTLVYGYGGQSVTLLPNGQYSITNPATEYANYILPTLNAGSEQQLCTYVYHEPSKVSGVSVSKSNFDLTQFTKSAGLSDLIASTCFYVINGQAPSSSAITSSPAASSSASAASSAVASSSAVSTSGCAPAVTVTVTVYGSSSVAPSTVASSSATASSAPVSSSPVSSAAQSSSVVSTSSAVVISSSAPASSSGAASSAVSSSAAGSSASVSSSAAASPSSAPASASASASVSSASSALPSTAVSSAVSGSASASSAAASSTSSVISASSSGSAAASSASSAAVSVSASTSSAPSASASASTSASATSSASSVANSTSISSSASAIISANATSTSVSSSASASATATSTEPNAAYQTNVSFNGVTYVNKGLVGFGAIDGSARDSFGETIGGIGSAIALQSFEKNGDSYTGVMVVQPDRGYNPGTVTSDYIARRHYVSFTLNPYYSSTDLTYDDAKSTFDLTYDSTIRFFEADGTATTGLNAEAKRNSTPPLPIANSTYNHISFDLEGVVLNADGTFWVSDEYGPYIYKVAADGTIITAVQPPTAFLPMLDGELYFDAESSTLPQTGRAQNAGFEGLTANADGSMLYVLLQTGLMQDLDSADDDGQYTRMLSYAVSGDDLTLVNAYVIELPVTNGNGNTLGASDFIYVSDDTFLILSRDGKGGGDDTAKSKHKDFLLFSTSGATDIAGTDYTDGVTPVAPGGVLVSSITPIVPVEFVDMIDDTQLGRFGLHNGGDFDVSLINRKWESSALASVGDENYPDDYFLFSFSDNDLTTLDGYEAGESFSADYSYTLDNQALVWRVTLPGRS